MNAEWKATLSAAGAEFDQETDAALRDFGNRTRELRASKAGNIIADMSAYGLISLRGADVESYLQGQLTNDIRPILNDARSGLAAVCTHKGRMQSCFRLFKRDDGVWLRLPKSMIQPTIDRLRMYVLMSDVAIEDASSALQRFGLSGPDAASLLAEQFDGPIPADVDDVVHAGPISVIRVPAAPGMQRFELFAEAGPLTRLWNNLNVNCAPCSHEAWQLTDIRAGLPTLYPATIEAFVPQMANMQAVNGVSFNKGCYTGQEVVARMQYRGELKRQMVLIESAEGLLAAGADLHVEEGKSAIGKVVDMVDNGAGMAVGLAVIRKEHLGATLTGTDSNDKILSLSTHAPPYPLGETEKNNA